MRCNENKSFSEFRVNKNNKSGYASYCYDCARAYSREYYEKKNGGLKYAKEKRIGDTRICSICNEYKNIKDFKNDKYSWCNVCQKEYDRKRNEKGLVKPRKIVGELVHCRHCEQYLDRSEFWGNDLTYCRPCKKKVGINSNLRKYKLTMETYSEMEKSQNGVCAICKDPEMNKKRLSVDHDHACCPGYGSCGKCIRGLLCSNCNTFLGNAKDDIEILKSAIEYLQKYLNA